MRLEHELGFTLWHSCPSWHEGFTQTSKNTNQTPKSCNHIPLQSPEPSSITERQGCGNPGEIPIPLMHKRLENQPCALEGRRQMHLIHETKLTLLFQDVVCTQIHPQGQGGVSAATKPTQKSHNSGCNYSLFQLLLCCVSYGSSILLFHNCATKPTALCSVRLKSQNPRSPE